MAFNYLLRVCVEELDASPKNLYETSVFNFVFADDAPDKKLDTITLFKEIEEGQYVPYTSSYVLAELRDAPEPKRSKIISLVTNYGIAQIESNDEIENLANIYIKEGVISVCHVTYAIHIAAATVHELDFITSWNFKHIVKRKTIMMTEGINIREGYKRIGIFSPTEVIENVS